MTHRFPSSPQQQGTTARFCELLASFARTSVAVTGGRYSSSARQGLAAQKHSERPNLKALHWSKHEVRITGTRWAVNNAQARDHVFQPSSFPLYGSGTLTAPPNGRFRCRRFSHSYSTSLAF